MGCGLLTCGVSLSLFSFNVGTFSNLFDPISALLINEIEVETFLMVQWLRLGAHNAEGPGSILGWGTRPHMPVK